MILSVSVSVSVSASVGAADKWLLRRAWRALHGAGDVVWIRRSVELSMTFLQTLQSRRVYEALF